VLRRRAFTLLEVLMVMALIGIVAGWAISRFSASGYRMDSNVRMLQNALIGAQQTAITRNVNVQVMFDAVNARVRVLLDADNDGTASASETVTYRRLDGARFLTPTRSIDGAPEFYLTGPGVIETGNPLQRAIRIAPNGALSGDVVVYIGTSAGRTADLRALAITGATARTAFWSHLTGAWRRRDY
jgi:prepilin-type N-terminal cleavage/methylation domain-containing protein